MAYNAVPGSGLLCKREFPNGPTSKVSEAAKSGDAVLLSKVLQEMDASKRAWLLESFDGHCTPLIVAAEHGHLDCVKVLLKYKTDVGSGSDDEGDDDDDDDDGDDDDDDDDYDDDGDDDIDFKCIPLVKASKYGHVNVVSFLIEQGTNINFQDEKGKTPLIKASKNGHMNVVSFLVEQGANVNVQDKEGNAPLMLATTNGHMNVVSFLVKQGANMNLQDKEGNTPLMSASKNGDMYVVSFLVEQGANVNVQDKEGNTPLMLASKNGHVNVVTFLAEQGAMVDLQDKKGKTALHHALKSNFQCHSKTVLETVRSLIKSGVNVNATTNDSCTPLTIAIKHCDVQVINFLIKHGANVELQDKDGRTALHHAVGNYETVRCLIENGANVNATTNDNCTPLMIASKYDDLRVINLLIKHGANVELQDKDGRTALYHAVMEPWNYRTVRCLIENGANVNATTNDNCTPLMIASEYDELRAINLLIKHGANVELQDKDGETALFHAVTSFSTCYTLETIRVLVENGADVNASRNDNCTPLMKAANGCELDMVTILIEIGADVDLQDKNGDTALHYAVRPYDQSWKYTFRTKDDPDDPCEVVNALLTGGAAQLCNNQQFTPLLLASKEGMDLMVDKLIKIPEYTKEQRIDALELLGATLVTNDLYDFEDIGFFYIMRGMKERFQDPSHPLLKQPMEPIEAYDNRKESQTLEELMGNAGNAVAIIMESLIIRERILGTDNSELLGQIRHVADYFKYRDSYKHKCIGLYRHAMKIAQHCNQSVTSDLNNLTSVLYERGWWNVPPRQKDFVFELLEQTVLEYEKQLKLGNNWTLPSLFTSLIQLVQIIAKFKCLEESKTSHVSVLLQKLFHLNPRDGSGNTLLHKAVEFIKRSKPRFAFEFRTPRPLYKFPCISTVKLLLNAGINVDASNNNGDTPLHKAVMYKPSSKNIHRLTNMLEALLDGGAHHDYVNNAGKTAMDIAQTDEARNILSERKKLELKCISARAVKKFGLPYLEMVPKILEKFISMH